MSDNDLTEQDVMRLNWKFPMVAYSDQKMFDARVLYNNAMK